MLRLTVRKRASTRGTETHGQGRHKEYKKKVSSLTGEKKVDAVNCVW